MFGAVADDDMEVTPLPTPPTFPSVIVDDREATYPPSLAPHPFVTTKRSTMVAPVDPYPTVASLDSPTQEAAQTSLGRQLNVLKRLSIY